MRSIVILGILMSVAPLASAAASTHREEEVTFSSGTITLAGTLSIPAGSGPFPAVVLLTGSGPQDRDSEVLGFRPFKVIADHLTGRGIAVLRFDDRGVGGSSGSIVNSTTEEFADDALAAIRVLRQREEIGRSPIGLIGHSEGAIVAAIAASKSADVAFIVWMAGSSVAGEQILQTQAAGLARNRDDPVGERLRVASDRLAEGREILAEGDGRLDGSPALADDDEGPLVLDAPRGLAIAEQFQQSLGGIVIQVVSLEVEARTAATFPATQFVEIGFAACFHQSSGTDVRAADAQQG